MSQAPDMTPMGATIDDLGEVPMGYDLGNDALSGLTPRLLRDRGRPDRHIIARRTEAGREHCLHATKGWRTRRLPQGASA